MYDNIKKRTFTVVKTVMASQGLWSLSGLAPSVVHSDDNGFGEVLELRATLRITQSLRRFSLKGTAIQRYLQQSDHKPGMSE